MIRRIAIEGIDGSGKTSVVQELAQQLQADGNNVSVFAPFQLAKEYVGEDLYRLWQSDETAEKALDALHNTLVDCEMQAEANGADVIIYDRHWMTAFTEIDGRPQLTDQWKDFVQTAVLRVPVETALGRCSNDLQAEWMTDSELKRYHEQYRNLTRKYGRHVLGIYRSDDDVTPEAIAANIAWDMRILR